MRIIAGYLGGRQFNTPHGHRTHPMSDKVRGALFNALGDIEGLSFLDAFAGSGALAMEAISRGAQNVIAIEKDSSAHRVIDENVAGLQLKNKIKVIRANVSGWSNHNTEKKFDVLLLDPPYDELQLSLMQKLVKRHLKPRGVAVLSYPGSEVIPAFDGYEVVADKDYGDALLIFYKKV